MKTTIVALATSVAVVAAAPGGIPSGTPINCAKPNANYCMAGDIILRCDGNGMGTRGRCSDNVAGYPPAGGVASCYQSSEEAGDAACQKNCVVYAAKPFTLAADKCTPSATVTSTQSDTHTGSATVPEGTSTGTASNPPSSSQPHTTETGIMSIPEGTSLGSATLPASTETGIVSIPEGTSLGTAPGTSSTPSKLTNPIRTTTATSSTAASDDCPAPTVSPTTTAGNQPTNSASTTTGPSSSASATSAPTAAANANHAAGALAAAGFVAALFL
ncbi:hypothetical protein QQS21_008762 [Conoideocrella luteorostrata]|uniref:Uncharacterized protein n=1 Tax=Conoideocrella luteorostrata TaxID=1105319 RepID=A0AAJ0CKY0_9HYPO|nr:hypothetical protein QQS21_008762 [Conoideocrella luteorostrata]